MSPRNRCAQHVEGKSYYAKQPQGRGLGLKLGLGHGKAVTTLAVTHFLCPEQGALARVMLWGMHDSFQSEAPPKIVTTSAFSQGKGEAQAGIDCSRALLPAGAACHAKGSCTGPGCSILLGQLCAFPAVPGVTQKLGVSTRSHRQQRAVPHRRSGDGHTGLRLAFLSESFSEGCFTSRMEGTHHTQSEAAKQLRSLAFQVTTSKDHNLARE